MPRVPSRGGSSGLSAPRCAVNTLATFPRRLLRLGAPGADAYAVRPRFRRAGQHDETGGFYLATTRFSRHRALAFSASDHRCCPTAVRADGRRLLGGIGAPAYMMAIMELEDPSLCAQGWNGVRSICLLTRIW